jgi:transposase-like protein
MPAPRFRPFSAPLRLLPAGEPAPSAAQRLAAAVRRDPRLEPRLRGALLLACGATRPFRSVCRLASAAGCDRRTLWRDWRHALGDASPLRLEDVLHWLILARAMEIKTPRRTWTAVAEEVAVHPQTLARFARQFTRRGLRAVAADPAGAASALERALLPHFGCAVDDNPAIRAHAA